MSSPRITHQDLQRQIARYQQILASVAARPGGINSSSNPRQPPEPPEPPRAANAANALRFLRAEGSTIVATNRFEALKTMLVKDPVVLEKWGWRFLQHAIGSDNNTSPEPIKVTEKKPRAADVASGGGTLAGKKARHHDNDGDIIIFLCPRCVRPFQTRDQCLAHTQQRSASVNPECAEMRALLHQYVLDETLSEGESWAEALNQVAPAAAVAAANNSIDNNDDEEDEILRQFAQYLTKAAQWPWEL